MNLSEGNPHALRATNTAELPGRQSIFIFSLIHLKKFLLKTSINIKYNNYLLTNRHPGSDMVGVPASDTRATFNP